MLSGHPNPPAGARSGRLFFPLAGGWNPPLAGSGCAGASLGPAVRESGAGRPFTERHLQCVWYDPLLRPKTLHTVRGEPLSVEHPGAWNLEAGPDFLSAAVCLAGSQRLEGDVEVHLRPADWRRHGHGRDPLYRNVRIHVTYYEGEAADLPVGAIHVSLRPALAALPFFSFDGLDLTAYPFAVQGPRPPCREVFCAAAPAQQAALLAACGRERLRRKALRLQQAVNLRGADQVLYEEILCSLGYKHNKLAFRRLAAALPVTLLRAESEGDPLTAYALLAGVAGLLPENPDPRWDSDTRVFLRTLWDRWWPRAAAWPPAGRLERCHWRLDHLRAANHPRRRMMAAALLFSGKEPFSGRWPRLLEVPPRTFVEESLRSLELQDVGYWRRRLALGGAAGKRPVALVGRGRAAAIVVNVLIPLRMAVQAAWDEDLCRRLPREDEHDSSRRMAHLLFGRDLPRSRYADGLRRQGLLLLHQDFCMNSRSGCRDCTLARDLRTFMSAP